MSHPVRTRIMVSVLEIRHLTDSAYVLKTERGGLDFAAGQYIALGLPGKGEMREYSLYSGEQDDYIEVLIREVDQGLVSRQLKYLSPGTQLAMDGPYGFFTINPGTCRQQPLLLIASGTGIAPFHSYVRSYPGLNYRILHGVRYVDESYDSGHYDRKRYTLCTSRDGSGDFHGRLTEYLRLHPPGREISCYLCGNSHMIHDAYDILTRAGIPAVNIHAEVYF